MAVGDFDGDGKPDIVADAYGTSSVKFLLSSRNYASWTVASQAGVSGLTIVAITVGDLNADGYDDLLVVSQGGATSAVSAIYSGDFALIDPNFTPSSGVLVFGPVTLISSTTKVFTSALIRKYHSVSVPDIVLTGSQGMTTLLGSIANAYDQNNWGVTYTVSSTGGDASTANPFLQQTVAKGDLCGTNQDEVAFSSSGAIATSCLNGFSLSAGSVMRSMATGDLDGDGRPDLVVGTTNSSNSAGQLFFFRNTGSGFTPFSGSPVSPAGGAAFTSIALADFDHDGKLDVAALDRNAGSNTMRIFVYLNNGNGSFTSQLNGSPYAIVNSNLDDFHIVAADFNGDGLPDLVTNGNVNQFLNTGGALFAPAPFRLNSGAGQTPPSAAVLPLRSTVTGSTWSAASNQAFLALSPTSGSTGATSGVTFSANQNSPAPLAAGTYPATATFSASGYPNATTKMSLQVNNPAGALTGATSDIILPSTYSDFSTDRGNFGLGDFNGDGKTDIVYLESSQLRLSLSNGTSGFTPSSVTGNFSYSSAVSSILTGDFNNDGKLDVVLFYLLVNDGGSGSNSYQVLLGDGAGGLTAQSLVTLRGLPPVPISSGGLATTASVAIGDVNADGNPDLVFRYAGTIQVLLGKGNGGFSSDLRPFSVEQYLAEGNFWLSGSSSPIQLGDFNNDGRVDILTTSNTLNNAIVLLRGNGDGTFLAPLGDNTYGRGPFLTGDVNNDGIPDLVYTNYQSVFAVLGGSNFPASPRPIESPSVVLGTQFKPLLVDINGDGNLDYVYSNGDDTSVYQNGHYWAVLGVMLGDGAGHFAQPVQYQFDRFQGGLPWGLYNISAADFDGDGRQDIYAWAQDPRDGRVRAILGASASTTGTLTRTTASVVYGQPAPVSYAVSAGSNAFSTPAGTAVLSESGTTIGVETRAGGGPWTFPASLPRVGSHTVSAVYQGDSRNAASPNSNTITFTVTQATGTLTVTSSLATSTYGQTVIFTATLSPASSGGGVTFKDGSSTLCTTTLDTNGQATCTTSALHGGSRSITAVFAGDSNIAAATSPAFTQTVNKASATVNVSNTSRTYTGSSLPITATATRPDLSALTVVVTYTVNSAPTTTAPSAVGSYAFSATVSDSDYAGTASGILTIGKATATVTITSASFIFDGSPKPVTFTTTPSGLSAAVSYTVNSAQTATAPSALGTYPYTITINDANYQGTASGTLDIHTTPVTAIAVTSSANPSTYGQAITLTATVTGGTVGKTGNVVIYDGATALITSAVGSGTVSYTTSAFTAGTHSITASYAGDAGNAAVTSAVFSQVVNKANATITVTGGPFAYNGSQRTASATTTPANLTVGFTYNNSATAPTIPGTYNVVGTINDNNYQGSNTATLIITPGSLGATFSGVASIPWTGTPHAATVTTTPPGIPVTVTYTPDGGSPTTIAPSAAGNYTVTASAPFYNNAVTRMLIGKSPVSVTINGLAAVVDGRPHAVTVLTRPAGVSYAVTYTASNNTTSGNPPTAADLYTVNVAITDPNYVGSGSAKLDLHNKNSTSITLAGPATTFHNQAATYTAKIAYGSPYNGNPATGFVAFTINNIRTITAPIIGDVATLHWAFAVGNNPIVANYSGDAENSAAPAGGASFSVNTDKATIPIATTGPTTFTYDGSPHAVGFTTPVSARLKAPDYFDPATGGLLAGPPVNVGVYQVSERVDPDDPYYKGSSTTTLTITRVPVTITLGSLNQPFTGSPVAASYTTSVPGVPVTLAYTRNGVLVTPTAVGSYTVIASVNDSRYTATPVTGTLTIANASVQFSIGDTIQPYNGQEHSVTVGTTPASLAISISYKDAKGAVLTRLPRQSGNYTAVVDVTQSGYTGHKEVPMVIMGMVKVVWDFDQVSNLSLDGATVNETLRSIDVSKDQIFTADLQVMPGTHTLHLDPRVNVSTRYVFQGWTGCVSSCSGANSAGDLTFTVGTDTTNAGPQSYKAKLREEVYLTVRASGGSNVDPGTSYAEGANVWVPAGQEVKLKAIPGPGLGFYRWENNLTSQTISFTPTEGQHDIRFEVQPAYRVKFGVYPAGAGSFTWSGRDYFGNPIGGSSSDGAVWIGRDANFGFRVQYASNPGWRFNGWRVNGGTTVAPFSQNAQVLPNADEMTIVANFVLNGPVLSASYEGTNLKLTNVGPMPVSNLQILGHEFLAASAYAGNTYCTLTLSAIGAATGPVGSIVAGLANGFIDCPVKPLPNIAVLYPLRYAAMNPGASASVPVPIGFSARGLAITYTIRLDWTAETGGQVFNGYTVFQLN